MPMKQASPGSIIEVGELDPALLVTAAEGVAGNNNDTTIPTNAALIAYIAAVSATRELSNLQNVAINTSLVSDTDNTDALGTTAIAWSDLFLGSGAVITFNSAPSTADITITHAVNSLTFAGGTIALGTATATGGLTGNVTGNVTGSAATVTGAAQTAITSLGTLTTLTVDDITINGNTISSVGASSLAITPTTGQAILLDSTISVDAGVVTGITSLGVTGTRVTAGFFTDLTVTNAIAGSVTGTAATVTGAAQTAITSVGTLTGLVLADAATLQLQESLIFAGVVNENFIVIPDNIDGNALAIKDSVGGAILMRFKTANGFEEITLYSNSKIDAAAILTVAGSGAGNGLVIPNHATASPTDASAAGSIFFEVDTNKLWVRNASAWVGVVLS